MRRLAFGCVFLAMLAMPLAAQEAPSESDQSATAFDAAAAWDEFEQVLRRGYAYIERDDIDVEAQLDRSRALAAKAPGKAAVRRIMHRTALTFMDPHLIVGPFEDDDYAIVMTAADLDARFEDGKAVIVDVRRGSPAFDAGLRPGDEVLSVDSKPARAAAQAPFGEVLPDPTANQFDYGLTLAVNGRRKGDRSLELRKANGQVRTFELGSTRDWADSLREREPVDLSFVGPRGDVAVLAPLNSLGNNDTITAFDAALKNAIAAGARAVILDMRETPSGGNTEVGRSIIGHFTDQVRPYQMHRIPALEREFTVPRQFVEYVFPREPFFGGPVFVLHGRWTGSMGEGIVIGMDAATGATTIGSNMGDLLGGLWNEQLELSGARVDLGGEALFHVDGTPREDYVANVPVEPASTARDGTDPVLAEALRLLEKR
ncbi:PDZ domain-containing protein [Citromicrobium bathyomarinum]|uniref:PDZ domain-containing protein n=1 Tax=Citromicrobium bathyomarinum TaxID=72174 RepID=UPI00315A22AC